MGTMTRSRANFAGLTGAVAFAAVLHVAGEAHAKLTTTDLAFGA